ncbi:DUF1330 domain-containing protein [Embleya hyalina]|uniref:DUF1330 domain-containing protein n=1 Tax=Embleya hyalina TaxID=516124 RepID=A0A401YR19_9ACTN|nr:DUF1330 domain-containing protein [Embleya hyalina]GCD97005.1 hypothetical protein EHYA_04692 [Embleya hyalina]
MTEVNVPPAYVVAILANVAPHAEVDEYLDRVQDTLAPFSGRYLVHGGESEVLEHPWTGSLVVIAFPSRAAAISWYESPAYRDIIALRTAHMDSSLVIVDGVPEGYVSGATSTSVG